jgi:hypothetical protein
MAGSIPWKVINALNTDREREQLNKILADINTTVGKLPTGVSTPTNTNTITTTSFAIANFVLTLSGAVTGTASVVNGNTVTLNTTLNPALAGVQEAPINNQQYVRENAAWVSLSLAGNDPIQEIRRRVSLGW